MDKQEMSYWQHLHTMNNRHNECCHTLTNLSSNEETPSTSCICKYELQDKKQDHKKRCSRKCGILIRCVVVVAACFVCPPSACIMSDYGSLFCSGPGTPPFRSPPGFRCTFHERPHLLDGKLQYEVDRHQGINQHQRNGSVFLSARLVTVS